jgi:hypothetical protein
VTLHFDQLGVPKEVETELVRLTATYDIRKLSDKGANGYLFIARNRVLERDVAIKFYYWADGYRAHLEPSVLAAEPTYISVANPVSFIVQKLLIHHLRVGRKKAQDLLYVHDTIELFATKLPALNALWREKIGPSLTQTQRANALERANAVFDRVTDDIREAVRIPSDRRIDPLEFQQRCKIGLTELLLDVAG